MQSTQSGEPGLDGRRGRRVVAAVERPPGEIRLGGNGGKAGGQRRRRVRPGVLRQRGQARVDAVERRGLGPLLLTGNLALGELELGRSACPEPARSAAGGESRQRRDEGHALTLVRAARLEPDLAVSAAEQGVEPREIDPRDRVARHRRRAASAGAAAKAHRLVQLLRLPRKEAFGDLFRIAGRIARCQVRLAAQDRRRFVRPVTAAPLDVHRQDHIGPQHAHQSNEVADDLVAPPLADHFLRIEGVPVIDRAREVLLGAVEAMGRQQLRRAEDGEILEQLGADLVLAAAAARRLQGNGPKAHPPREQRQQRVVLVIGMRGDLHERAGHVQPAERQPERHVAIARVDELRARAGLRGERSPSSARICHQGCSDDCPDQYTVHHTGASWQRYGLWLAGGTWPASRRYTASWP